MVVEFPFLSGCFQKLQCAGFQRVVGKFLHVLVVNGVRGQQEDSLLVGDVRDRGRLAALRVDRGDVEAFQKTEFPAQVFRVEVPVRRPDDFHVVGIRPQNDRLPVQKILIAGHFEFPETEAPRTAVDAPPGRILPFHVHVVQVRMFRRPELGGRIRQFHAGVPGGFRFPDFTLVRRVAESEEQRSVRNPAG